MRAVRFGTSGSREALSDASHELRTPLTALRTEVELALLGNRDASELRPTLRSAADEIRHVCRLADDILILAGADHGRLPLLLWSLEPRCCSRRRRPAPGAGPRPKSGRSSRYSAAKSRPGLASPLPARWRPASDAGAVKLKDLTARQVQKALAELPACSLRPPLLSTRLTRSLAHGEQPRRQPAVDLYGRGLRSRVCLAGRSGVCQPE